MARAIVFSHFNGRGRVDGYVYYYLAALLDVAEKVVFVTTSGLASGDAERLEAMGVEVIARENVGYDFYSYKVGLESLQFGHYDELVICNDSVFGPFYSFSRIFEYMGEVDCDFWGVTGSTQHYRHVQSYFVCFRKPVLASSQFREFWDGVRIIEDKQVLVDKYEIGLSRVLSESGFRSSVLVGSDAKGGRGRWAELWSLIVSGEYDFVGTLKAVFRWRSWRAFLTGSNVSVRGWDRIIESGNMPFLKKALFSMPASRDAVRVRFRAVIGGVSDYPLKLIEDYIDDG